MNLDPSFLFPGFILLAVLAVALLAALGIALVSGFSGAALAFLFLAKARARKGDPFNPTRMWEELKRTKESTTENI